MPFRFTLPKVPWYALRVWVVVGLTAGLGLTYSWWWPRLSFWVDETITSYRSSAKIEGEVEGVPEKAGGDHSHDHSGHAHGVAESLRLTAQARQNLGLVGEAIRPVALSDYQRMLSVPAVVTARTGRTHLTIATPLTGIVTHVHAIQGEAVLSGTLLFDVRLTHEGLVTTQTEFLQSLGELDVEVREIARLQAVTQSGAVSGKTLLERQYAKEKLEALLSAQREALRLHGLSDRQIQAIEQDRQLLQNLQVFASSVDEHPPAEEFHLSGARVRPVAYQTSERPTPLVIEQLDVQKGQAVTAGESLARLADYSQLFIEGHAFEQDTAAVARAAERGWSVEAVAANGDSEMVREGLMISFVANTVERETRTLPFYVDLSNQILRDTTNDAGQRFVTWTFRPGQRMQLMVPIESWKDQIVLPVDAVVRDGADWFVFQQNGDHFDRIAVHVKHRDQRSVVVANDGSIFPGDRVAWKAAHQMQMAIKNQSGGGADPHAGHNH